MYKIQNWRNFHYGQKRMFNFLELMQNISKINTIKDLMTTAVRDRRLLPAAWTSVSTLRTIFIKIWDDKNWFEKTQLHSLMVTGGFKWKLEADGSGAVIEFNNRTQSLSHTNPWGCSVINSELKAIEMPLNCLNKSIPIKTVFFVGSMAALQEL